MDITLESGFNFDFLTIDNNLRFLLGYGAVDIQEHKCAGVYNLENDIDELVKDKEQLTIDLFALKTQNQI